MIIKQLNFYSIRLLKSSFLYKASSSSSKSAPLQLTSLYKMSYVNFFADSFIDRCSDKRKNKDWVNEQLKCDQTNFILFHIDKPFVNIDKEKNEFSLCKLKYSQVEFLFKNNEAAVQQNQNVVIFLGLEYKRLVDENNNNKSAASALDETSNVADTLADEFINYKSPYLSPDTHDRSVYTPWFAIDTFNYDNDYKNIEKLFTNASFLQGNFIRMLSMRNKEEASLISQARSILCWHDRNQFCASCGTKTFIEEAGFKRTCPDKLCKSNDKSLNVFAPSNICYPRVDPVVIMLVVNKAKTHFLLGRKKSFPKTMFSCLAGFVEAGESIEEAVKREIHEECGIFTNKIVFHSSQPWPFPSNIMIGCLAYATSDDIKLDNDEIEEARWFSLDEIEKIINSEHPDSIMIPPSRAIANRLIKYWFRNKSKL